jgi:hypothetical protein
MILKKDEMVVGRSPASEEVTGRGEVEKVFTNPSDALDAIISFPSLIPFSRGPSEPFEIWNPGPDSSPRLEDSLLFLDTESFGPCSSPLLDVPHSTVVKFEGRAGLNRFTFSISLPQLNPGWSWFKTPEEFIFSLPRIVRNIADCDGSITG